MWKKGLIIAGVFLFLIGLLVIGGVLRKSNARRALEAYKTELQAKGEPLTWEDLGYPPAGETNISMDALLAVVSKLGKAQFHPGELDPMHFVGPGVARVGWTLPHPPVSSSAQQGTNAATWRQFIANMDASSNALADIRAFLETPPSYFPMNLTNPLAPATRNPFVQKRTAAQWLAADSLVALHQGDVDRSQADLHALTQMVQLHRNDVTLVSAMIRVAISGLGLSATWEALPANGWDEDALVRLQGGWEGGDLIDALERGMVGERVSVPHLFEHAAATWSNPIQLSTGAAASWSIADLPREVLGRVATAYWRSHMEEDQLLYLQMKQQRIDILRRLRTNAPGFVLRQEMAARDDELHALIGDPLANYRYLITSIAMPNYTRAMQMVIRNETHRRMTITAIALKRHHLKHGRYPASLDVMVPDFVSSVPIDPMSGHPFGYSTNLDGSFTLHSVGEDGMDDGGDATSTNTVASFDLWSGRDAVWPRVATNETSLDQ